jgi:transposase-like protein
MKYYKAIGCPHCKGTHLGKVGKSAKGVRRYFCKNDDCKTHTFMLEYHYKACEAGIKEKIIDMAVMVFCRKEIQSTLDWV